MPNTLQEFQVGQKVYIPDILSQLQSGLSHLTPGSEAPPNGGIANNYGNLEININCNYHGKVNCAPVAFMQFQDQGLDIHVIFYEIRNRDGSSGWLVVYDFDSQQRNGPYAYPRLVANPTGPFDLTIDTRANATFQKIKPYAVSLMTLDFINAINTLITSGNVPDPLNDGSMIVAGAP